jgi:predicted DCC family thiol-disulfide oxidoreductase YuxK
MSEKLNVYFDGLCHLCSREINHYRSMKGAENINFIDITSPNFDATQEGLDPIEIHKNMHVRDRQGRLHLGVDAFIWIWNELPALRFLVPIARVAPIHLVLKICYSVFAKVRPLLPRKSCEDSPYCETHIK